MVRFDTGKQKIALSVILDIISGYKSLQEIFVRSDLIYLSFVLINYLLKLRNRIRLKNYESIFKQENTLLIWDYYGFKSYWEMINENKKKNGHCSLNCYKSDNRI